MLRTFAVGRAPQGGALNRRGTRLHVANEQGYLNDIDLRTGSRGDDSARGAAASVSESPPTTTRRTSRSRARAWCRSFGLQNRRLWGTLHVGGDPRRIAFSRAGKVGAITNAAGYLTFIK